MNLKLVLLAVACCLVSLAVQAEAQTQADGMRPTGRAVFQVANNTPSGTKPATKSAAAVKAGAKKVKSTKTEPKTKAAKKPKSKEPQSKTPYMQNAADHTPLNLDYSQYPIDPRKPCSQCVRPCDSKTYCRCDLPGIKGRPNIDKPIGGRECGDCKNCRRDLTPLTNIHWPVPRAAKRENHHPGFSGWLDDPCRPRITDIFDKLGDVRICSYRRTDNGYCGMGRDPYGCLGESKQLEAGVNGLQFRQPGEPLFGTPIYTGNASANGNGFGFGFGFPGNERFMIR